MEQRPLIVLAEYFLLNFFCILLDRQFSSAVELFYNFNVSYATVNPLGLPQQQRKTSWQDGVTGTNCPIPPGWNWTYQFQVKDQIGSFFYFPSTQFQKAAGGYGSIRINNRATVPVPFLSPEDDFFLLIGDWFTTSHKKLRASLDDGKLLGVPDGVLMNGKASYNNSLRLPYETFTIKSGYTYRFRVSNVGIATSLNLRIQDHKLRLVETEGSYVQQQDYDSLDIHVGQSYSFLLTGNQNASDYYIVASPRGVNRTVYENVVGIAILHYSNSTTTASGPLPQDPAFWDTSYSINQAFSIRWNLSAGAARVNPQGSFHQSAIAINQTFLLQSSTPSIDNKPRYAVNDISYLTPDTPLKLADYYNLSGIFETGIFPDQPSNMTPKLDTSVISGLYRGFAEFVFLNNDTSLQSWHIDGYAFFAVGMGNLPWTNASRSTYNRWDAVARATTQVYPGMWTAVLVELDNVGMWNIRSEVLQRWYLGEELYMKVHNPEDLSHRTELSVPSNALYCGKLSYLQMPQNHTFPPSPPHTSKASPTYAFMPYPILLALLWILISL